MHRAGGSVEGRLLRIDTVWTTFVYWLVCAVALFALFFALLFRIHEYATGPAVVRVDGARTLTAAAEATVESVSVEPGSRVSAGDPLVFFYDTKERADYQRITVEFEHELARLLRDPTDATVRATLAGLRTRREQARAVLEERVVTAPIDGIVSDVRIHAGQHLAAGEIVLSVAPIDAPVSLVAVLPGQYRPMLREGQVIRFSLDGYRNDFRDVPIETIGTEVVGPQEVQRYFGKELGDAVKVSGPSVLVRGKLPSRRFSYDGKEYGYFGGLTGIAEARVKSEPIAVMLFPSLRGPLLGTLE